MDPVSVGKQLKAKYPAYQNLDDATVGNIYLKKFGANQQAPQPLPQQSNTPPNTDNFFSKGVGATIADWTPAAGGIIGGLAGGALGIETGPGAIATAVAGGAAGQAAGEALKQKLQGKDQINTQDVAGQAVVGGAGALGGELLGPALDLAEKVPVAGAVVGSLRSLPDTFLAKIVGTGDVSTVEGGVNGLVKTAREVGLDKIGSIPAKRAFTNDALQTAGKVLGDTLSQADTQGAGVTYGSLLKLIDENAPKITSDSAAATELVNNAKTTIAAKVGSIAKEVPHDGTLVPVSVVNDLKQFFADAGKFQLKNPNTDQLFSRSISSSLRDSVEQATKGLADVRDLNQQWWNLKQIQANLTKADARALTGRTPSIINPLSWTRIPSVQTALSQAGPAANVAIKAGINRNLQSTMAPQTLSSSNTGTTDAMSTFPVEAYPATNLIQDVQRDPKNAAQYRQYYSMYHQQYTDAVDAWKKANPKAASPVGLSTKINQSLGGLLP